MGGRVVPRHVGRRSIERVDCSSAEMACSACRRIVQDRRAQPRQQDHDPIHVILDKCEVSRQQQEVPAITRQGTAEGRRAHPEARPQQTTRRDGCAGDLDHLVVLISQECLVGAPQPHVDARPVVRHHQHEVRGQQRQSKRRLAWIGNQAADVQILRVGKHAAVGVAGTPGPRVEHLPEELENTFLPSMCDEEVALQTIRVQHEGPTHPSSRFGHRFDKLLIDGVQSRADGTVTWIEFVQCRGLDLAQLDRRPNSALKIDEVCPTDAPVVLGNSPVHHRAIL
mmetsp:Transcript_141231/g.367619  ORF Transcript_141231/g.367619 Transcript_141231/m.367619 type:complete len:282 (+) Transcript_141231:496-1341(+)